MSDGAKIALASAGALALLAQLSCARPMGQARRASLGRRGSANAALAPVPPGYSREPSTFFRSGGVLERDVNAWAHRVGAPDALDEDIALYHVTTARDAVLSSRIKSRAQLRAQVGDQARSFGLGGGEEQADMVSVGVTLNGARRVAAALRHSILAAQGKLSAADAAVAVLGWTGFPRSVRTDEPSMRDHDGYYRILQILSPQTAEEMTPDEVSTLHRQGAWQWRTYAREAPDMAPCDVFDLISALEEEIFVLGRVHGYEGCIPAVRVLEPCEKIAKMNADQVAILAMAARVGARPTEVPSECELRFRPEDLVVLGEVRGHP